MLKRQTRLATMLPAKKLPNTKFNPLLVLMRLMQSKYNPANWISIEILAKEGFLLIAQREEKDAQLKNSKIIQKTLLVLIFSLDFIK